MSAGAVLSLGFGPSGSAAKILRLGFGPAETIEPPAERPLNLGGYVPPVFQPQKQTGRGAVRISGGGSVRVAGRKVLEGTTQVELAVHLMMDH